MNTIVKEGSYEGKMKKYIVECLNIVTPLLDKNMSLKQTLITLLEFTEKTDALYENLQTMQQIEENHGGNHGVQN